jgi:ABC-type Fe3+ transport system permease subunit
MALVAGLLVGLAMFVLAEPLACDEDAAVDAAACISEEPFLPQLGNAVVFAVLAAGIVLVVGALVLSFSALRRRHHRHERTAA